MINNFKRWLMLALLPLALAANAVAQEDSVSQAKQNVDEVPEQQEVPVAEPPQEEVSARQQVEEQMRGGEGKPLRPEDIDVKYATSPNSGRFRVLSMRNKSNKAVTIYAINEYDRRGLTASTKPFHLNPGEKWNGPEFTCNKLSVESADGERFFLRSMPGPNQDTAPAAPSASAKPAQVAAPQEDQPYTEDFDDGDYEDYDEEEEEDLDEDSDGHSGRKSRRHSRDDLDSSVNTTLYFIVTAVILALFAALGLWYRKAKAKNKVQKQGRGTGANGLGDEPLTITNRATSAITSKHSISDVAGSNAYMKIDCRDFCADSAIRTLYLKNTFVKELYNMYAEDIQDPKRSNEDGCLVVGRWVEDTTAHVYDMTLEQMLQPGTDAVFSENELNFGSRYRMKLTDCLRKLRRQSGLHYDLVCWVHSHPGTGVSISNSDGFVHTQLHHPGHPNTLVAIIVDVLAPKQELAVYTSRADGTLNTRNDLTRTYSLVEMYQWAVSIDRRDIRLTDYYDTLANAKAHTVECVDILLSNGAIIDMAALAAENKDVTAFVHGFALKRQNGKTGFVANAVKSDETVPDNEVVGIFVMARHCSIPSIRKSMGVHQKNIHFALVYSIQENQLTSVPVANNELCTLEVYHGEHKLEDLEIWTRRKR